MLAPAVRKYLHFKLPGDNDVDEVCQDVFLSALDSLALYKGEASLKTWILSIARHEVADYWRKRYVRRAIEKTSPLFDGLMADINTPEFEMKKAHIRERFMKAYHSLSEQYRTVLSYRFELGMSVKEISVRMEMPFKATESLLFRARRAFIIAYEKTGE
jgi:RNA polymerase sigma-70 factor (ECF subfamily)